MIGKMKMVTLNENLYKKEIQTANSGTSNPLKKKNLSNKGGMLIFPDGARISYRNITEKNIYMIIDKYSDYLHPDMTGMGSNLKYKMGRLALTFNDGNAKICIGKINSMGFEYMYKMQYFNNSNLSAIYYYPNKNYEELKISHGEYVSKSYNALHQLVKMEEISNNETRIYEINPETNDIKCITA